MSLTELAFWAGKCRDIESRRKKIKKRAVLLPPIFNLCGLLLFSLSKSMPQTALPEKFHTYRLRVEDENQTHWENYLKIIQL